MSREDHIYERTTGFDLNSTGTIAQIDAQGISEVSTRLTSGTSTTYTLQVSNDDTNWWDEATFSSTTDVDDTRTLPERYVRLQLTSGNTVDDTADAELTASA